MKSYLILVRHGESRWNLANKFTGWVDVPLSPRGVDEAMRTAKELRDFEMDVAFTSKLKRAQETLNIILAEQRYTGVYLHARDWKNTWFLRYNNKEFEEDEIPVHSSAKLNERYYGKLQGINKEDAKRHWGKDQVHLWRRSYSIAPPGGESLKQVVKRAVPYFKSTIMKHVKAHQNVLVAAHGNSLRAIIKYIEGITDEDIPHLELATGKPIIYEYENGVLTPLDELPDFNRPMKWREGTEPAKRKVAKKSAKRKSTNVKSSTRKSTKKKTAKKKAPARKTAAKKKVAKKKTTRKVAKKTSKRKTTKSTRKTKAKTKTSTRKPSKKASTRKTSKKGAKKSTKKKAPARKTAAKKKSSTAKKAPKRKVAKKAKKSSRKTSTKKSTKKKTSRR
jgi:2,3-bisphosphoglycerate-dependent phosphoglycerate mutase